jgi:DNA-binding transcriptional LysR family regulator
MRRPSWKVAGGRIEQLGRGVLPDIAGHGRQLRHFCAAARMESFTPASEQEGVAQPSLWQQILKLESEMGAPLFERLGRSVRLTPCGELLLPQGAGDLAPVYGCQGLRAESAHRREGPLDSRLYSDGHALSRCQTHFLVPG